MTAASILIYIGLILYIVYRRVQGQTVIAGILSFGLGLLHGRADKLSARDGAVFMKWGAASVAIPPGPRMAISDH